jgi:hypothetical protein
VRRREKRLQGTSGGRARGSLIDLAAIHEVLPPLESGVGLPKAFLGNLAQNAKQSQPVPPHNGSGLSR